MAQNLTEEINEEFEAFEDGLASAAGRAGGGAAQFEAFYHVVVTIRGSMVWEGTVYRFTTQEGRVHAWVMASGEGPQYIAVLQQPPFDSPLAVVRAWIDSQPR